MNLNLLGMATWQIVMLVVLGVLVLVFAIILVILPVKIWFIALVSGSHISMGRLIGMKLRKINVKQIVDAYIKAKKAGLTVDIVELETHDMAGGNVEKVVDALISAHSAKIALSIDSAKAIDLAGRDVLGAVKDSVTPKVIETDTIAAIAKDGIELKVKARVTVKANIQRIVGGAGEETIIARVGEGIVTTVGSAEVYEVVLENPDLISKTVLSKGLDVGTAYEILSIDIADIDVGNNVGAKLAMDEADAEKIMSQAKAEERRAMAEANEQEMRAKKEEMRAMYIAAEAEVPKAMANAIKEGKIGVMDYYRMQNLISDTAMRNALASTDSNKKKSDY